MILPLEASDPFALAERPLTAYKVVGGRSPIYMSQATLADLLLRFVLMIAVTSSATPTRVQPTSHGTAPVLIAKPRTIFEKGPIGMLSDGYWACIPIAQSVTASLTKNKLAKAKETPAMMKARLRS